MSFGRALYQTLTPHIPGNFCSFLLSHSRTRTCGAPYPSAIAEMKFPFDAAPHQTTWAGALYGC